MYALPDGRGVDAQELGDLLGGHLFEIAQHEGLAIDVGQPVEAGPWLLSQQLPVEKLVGPARRPQLGRLRGVGAVGIEPGQERLEGLGGTPPRNAGRPR